MNLLLGLVYTKEKSLYNLKEVLIMDLLEVMRSRRSVRTYTGETVAEEKVDQILKAELKAMGIYCGP